jgi:hypothetical protein
MRLTLTEDEIERILNYIIFNESEKELHNKILQQINIKKNRDISMKQKAVKIARATKSEITKNKIKNAVIFLNSEKKNITTYTVCRASGVCFNTAKKYLAEFKN